MARVRFTDVYDKTRENLKSYTFSADNTKMLEDTGVKGTFAKAEGPDYTSGLLLDKYRQKLSGGSEGDKILDIAGLNKSSTQTLTAAQVGVVASLKTARHMYLQLQAGAQSIWIYAGPFSHHDFPFEEFKDTTAATAKTKLDKTDEVYNKEQRKVMATGVNQALAWCQKCVASLGAPDAKTKGLVKTWFFPGTPTDEKVASAATTLNDGFKKISALLGSTKLIFSDDPIDRMKGEAVGSEKHFKSNWNDYGFVAANAGERLDVVYIQNGALKAWASADRQWIATLTIIHELSHRVLLNKDVVYDFTGLKPNDKLTFEHAIKNADSWGYFAADLNGKLPDAKRTEVYKGPAALRQAYLDSLGS